MSSLYNISYYPSGVPREISGRIIFQSSSTSPVRSPMGPHQRPPPPFRPTFNSSRAGFPGWRPAPRPRAESPERPEPPSFADRLALMRRLAAIRRRSAERSGPRADPPQGPFCATRPSASPPPRPASPIRTRRFCGGCPCPNCLAFRQNPPSAPDSSSQSTIPPIRPGVSLVADAAPSLLRPARSRPPSPIRPVPIRAEPGVSSSSVTAMLDVMPRPFSSASCTTEELDIVD